MKNLYRLFTGATVATLLLFNSCVPEDLIVEDLSIKLTSGSWTFSSLVGDDDFTTEFYTAAYEDNVLNFNSDGTCTDKLNVFNGTGTWSLSDNQDELTLSITYDQPDQQGARNETWIIKSITNSELVYDFTFNSITLEMTYVH